MTKYFNVKTAYGIETVDEVSTEDFATHKEYRMEVKNMAKCYSESTPGIYLSNRSTKEWRNK